METSHSISLVSEKEVVFGGVGKILRLLGVSKLPGK